MLYVRLMLYNKDNWQLFFIHNSGWIALSESRHFQSGYNAVNPKITINLFKDLNAIFSMCMFIIAIHKRHKINTNRFVNVNWNVRKSALK